MIEMSEIRKRYPTIDFDRLPDDVWNKINEIISRPLLNWQELDDYLEGFK